MAANEIILVFLPHKLRDTNQVRAPTPSPCPFAAWPQVWQGAPAAAATGQPGPEGAPRRGDEEAEGGEGGGEPEEDRGGESPLREVEDARRARRACGKRDHQEEASK
jgi:hypothetical protein